MLDAGKPFAKNFRETIGRLFRRLFRVYAHLYSNHFDHICALGIEGACVCALAARVDADCIGLCSASEHKLSALLPVRERGE